MARAGHHSDEVGDGSDGSSGAVAALFLSPKTVEYHLRSIYRKLGVSSRDELGAVLADLS